MSAPRTWTRTRPYPPVRRHLPYGTPVGGAAQKSQQMAFQPAIKTTALCHSCLHPLRPDAFAYVLRPSRDSYFRAQKFHEQCRHALRPEFARELVRVRTKRPLRSPQQSVRLKAGRRAPRPRKLMPRMFNAFVRLTSATRCP